MKYDFSSIIERAKHPTFGYYNLSSEYYESIINWHATRNGVKGLTAEAIGYENGVLGCAYHFILEHFPGVELSKPQGLKKYVF